MEGDIWPQIIEDNRDFSPSKLSEASKTIFKFKY